MTRYLKTETSQYKRAETSLSNSILDTTRNKPQSSYSP